MWILTWILPIGDNKNPKSAPELDQLAIPIEVDYSTEQNAGNTANSIASYYYKENVGTNDIGSSSSVANRRFSGKEWASTLIFAYSTRLFFCLLNSTWLDYFNNIMVFNIENIDI